MKKFLLRGVYCALFLNFFWACTADSKSPTTATPVYPDGEMIHPIEVRIQSLEKPISPCEYTYSQQLTVTIQFLFEGVPSKTETLTAQDMWNINQKDPGRTEQLLEYAVMLEEKRPEDFVATIKHGKVEKVEFIDVDYLRQTGVRKFFPVDKSF